jgi:hypothetical protein
MTCAHVAALLDAAPFADLTAQQLDAAHAHAATCATCAATRAQLEALTSHLRSLPMPAAPSSLAATVQARLARIDESRETVPAPRPSLVPHPVRSFAAMLAGVVLIALASKGLIAMASPFDVLRGRIGAIGLAAVTRPDHLSAAAMLVAGLCLCVYGLSVPMSRPVRTVDR